MGSIFSYFFQDTGRTDDPNPTTKLTSRDVYLIQSSWIKIRADPTKYGCAMFLTFFKKHPEYIELFPFKDTSFEELAASKKFQAHANSAFYAFNGIVDHLKDTELLLAFLKKTGVTHKARKATPEAFWYFRDAILEVLAPEISVQEKNSWEKVLKVATEVMVNGLKEN